jgi:hypothetical protein
MSFFGLYIDDFNIKLNNEEKNKIKEHLIKFNGQKIWEANFYSQPKNETEQWKYY